jgi:hypothetical protein
MLMETEVGVVYSMIPGKNMKLVSMYPPKCSKPDGDVRSELFCRGETDCDGRKELEVGTICRCTYSGRPPGTAEFIGELKQKTRPALEFWKAARIEGCWSSCVCIRDNMGYGERVIALSFESARLISGLLYEVSARKPYVLVSARPGPIPWWLCDRNERTR